MTTTATKHFDKALDDLGVTDMAAREALKAVVSEDELLEAMDKLNLDHPLFLVCKEEEGKYGCTYPMFDEDKDVPSVHMVNIGYKNKLVLTHELAHVEDFDAHAADDHGPSFMAHWKRLAMEASK